MTGRRRTVFLTGATGNWGRHVLLELLWRSDVFDVVTLVLPTERDTAAIRPYEDAESLRVVFGDLTDPAAVATCVQQADVVLHVGAVVSPHADDHPELAHRVNVNSMANIVAAVRALPDPGAVAVVGIGSVAQTGDRNPPHHWGRVGDPLQVSRYDEYGQSKIIAEKILVDSGLPRWTWLRQTGIFHPGVLSIRDAIMTHSPFEGVMEWVSVEDAARLLVNLCHDDVPAAVWGDVWNIGGGEDWRLTNWELQTRMTAALGVTDVRRWYERRWFATRNFHGQWYSDSDRLDELVPFRQDTFDAALARAVASAPATVRMAGRVPSWLVKNVVLKPLTLQPRGTMAWIRDGDEERIDAYYGSREQYEAIGDWATFWPPRPDRTPTLLDHGYDETLAQAEWDRDVFAGVADFRGGVLLSEDVRTGDITTPLQWRCAEGHTFTGSPRLVLRAGHWCPQCVRRPEDYASQARSNAFLRQLQADVPASV